MPRIVWLVLKDGRSMIAGCGTSTREGIERALSEPERSLTFTSDDRVDVVPSGAVRDFVVFDAQMTVPLESAIYRLVRF
jgi:hypothetical protein